MLFIVLKKPISYPRYLQFQETSRRFRRESILFLEHSPVITAGINAKDKNLLLPSSELFKLGIPLYQIPRGGDYTAHEPGQIVVYFHVDLRLRKIVPLYFLDWVTQTLKESIQEIWGVPLIPNKENPGLYRGDGKKIVSIGFSLKGFFTSFGIALNYVNSLHTFQFIQPCGMQSNLVTNLQSSIDKWDPKWENEKKNMWIHQLGKSLEFFCKKYPLPKPEKFRWIE